MPDEQVITIVCRVCRQSKDVSLELYFDHESIGDVPGFEGWVTDRSSFRCPSCPDDEGD